MMNQPSPPPFNPYLPPQSREAPRHYDGRPATRSNDRALTWAYAVLAAIGMVILGATWFVRPALVPALMAIATLFVFGKMIVGVCWLHAAWTGIDPTMRSGITPGGAVGRLFIPFYNFYWLFHVHSALCNALNLMRIERGLAPDAPRGLAFGASMVYLFSRLAFFGGTELVAFVGVVSSAAWLMYMARYAQARSAIDREPARA
jgi:hypothetical protein